MKISFTVTITDIQYTLLENIPIKKRKGPIKTPKFFRGLIKFYLGTLKT